MSQGELIAIFAILMIPGLLGTLLPILPGIPLMFVVAVVFGFVDEWQHLVPWELGVLFGIVLLSLLADFLSGLIGARYGGATRRAVLLGLIGFVIGILVFPPFGGFIGLFIGVFVGELSVGRKQLQAIRAATGSLLGSLVGIAVSFFLALVFLGLFIFFALY